MRGISEFGDRLHGRFEIDTPVGKYNPDWAIVKHEDETLIFSVLSSLLTPMQSCSPAEKPESARFLVKLFIRFESVTARWLVSSCPCQVEN